MYSLIFESFQMLRQLKYLNKISSVCLHKVLYPTTLLATNLGEWSYSRVVCKVHIFWEGHKILQNLHLLSYVVPVKSKLKISQNFVASSEYMNFIV